MICKYCGKDVPENCSNCTACGRTVKSKSSEVMVPNTMLTISFVIIAMVVVFKTLIFT